MTRKMPSDFENHADWVAYVREHIPESEQDYKLACGRTELFRSFYKTRKQDLPDEFARELPYIEMLIGSARTIAFEQLNERIFANLVQLLFLETRPAEVGADTAASLTAREQVDELTQHLVLKNPHYALWTAYRKGTGDYSTFESWDDYLNRELGSTDSQEVDFTHAMIELDKLLAFFRDRNQALPRFTFERVWFLHYLREPERMLQTRAVLTMLMAEMGACTSA